MRQIRDAERKLEMEREDNQVRLIRAEEFSELYDCQEPLSQTQATLAYIKRYGSITPLEALNAFGCLRLGARISDLKKLGYHIRTEINKGKKHYAIYSLVEEKEEQ